MSTPFAVRPEDEPALDKLKLQVMQYEEEESDFRVALAGARTRVAAAGYPGGVIKTVVIGGLIRVKRTVWLIGPHNDWMFDAKGRMYHSQASWLTRVIPTTPDDLRWHAMHGEVSLKSMTTYLDQMCQAAA